MKVAIVEDEFDYLHILKEFLEDLEFEVTPAVHPDKLTDVEKYDAFIMDVRIDKDRTAGIDFISKIQKEDRMKRDAVIIFISNYERDFPLVQDKLAQIPQYQWLDKPVDTVALENILRSIK